MTDKEKRAHNFANNDEVIFHLEPTVSRAVFYWNRQIGKSLEFAGINPYFIADLQRLYTEEQRKAAKEKPPFNRSREDEKVITAIYLIAAARLDIEQLIAALQALQSTLSKQDANVLTQLKIRFLELRIEQKKKEAEEQQRSSRQ